MMYRYLFMSAHYAAKLEEELRVFKRGGGVSPHPPFSYAGVSATLVPLAETSVSVIPSCQGPESRDSMDANSCKMRVVTYEASVRAYCSREWVSGVEVDEGIYKRKRKRAWHDHRDNARDNNSKL